MVSLILLWHSALEMGERIQLKRVLLWLHVDFILSKKFREQQVASMTKINNLAQKC